MKKRLRKFLEWWRGGKPCYLRGYDGRVYETIARSDPFGYKVAYIYHTYKIGHVLLSPCGKIHPDSKSSYIKSWKPKI